MVARGHGVSESRRSVRTVSVKSWKEPSPSLGIKIKIKVKNKNGNNSMILFYWAVRCHKSILGGLYFKATVFSNRRRISAVLALGCWWPGKPAAAQTARSRSCLTRVRRECVRRAGSQGRVQPGRVPADVRRQRQSRDDAGRRACPAGAEAPVRRTGTPPLSPPRPRPRPYRPVAEAPVVTVHFRCAERSRGFFLRRRAGRPGRCVRVPPGGAPAGGAGGGCERQWRWHCCSPVVAQVVKARFGGDSYLAAFGIEVSTRMCDVQGRVLPPPRLLYGGRVRSRSRSCRRQTPASPPPSPVPALRRRRRPQFGANFGGAAPAPISRPARIPRSSCGRPITPLPLRLLLLPLAYTIPPASANAHPRPPQPRTACISLVDTALYRTVCGFCTTIGKTITVKRTLYTRRTV